MDGLSLPLGSMIVQAALVNGLADHQPDSAASAIKVIASLTVVLGLLLIGLAWSRRFLNRGNWRTQGPTLRVLGGVCVGLKKNICLVEVPGSILVVGVSPDAISLLTTIENKEAQDMIKEPLKEKDQDASLRSRLSNFTLPLLGAECERNPKELFSFVKEKLPTLSTVRRIRPRLYPVLVGKHEQE
ncbi:MAG TPA: flagellar biosynthetic protein FliO [Thermodesulfobacteriota bacterium]|nr:flagellar biosynthetic protein FliO [Deltaproteobacteria bacterium]HNR13049.1 flagellar biosynthetic protein FliO [Thermodesulfobacteriota bacterium]HNU70125.1 flagellar biosynthetic protein FliO [Thermodesulfobacteriota bacterium]HOC38005.1 flagellar biosynthetic protein FliO [Thermodesulfobacteriota bacterium]HQO79199.1 flagellar biosynthetic protein FliO [Thermodesulfobacteriota bacterium]